jgi:hypothetical protein
MTDTRQVWYARLGPCWCVTRPGADGSYDLLRWRVRAVDAALIAVNLVIATAVIPGRVADSLRRAVSETKTPWHVVTYRVCPVAAKAGELATADVVEVATIMEVAGHLAACIAESPELLALALISGDLAPPARRVGRMASLST